MKKKQPKTGTFRVGMLSFDEVLADVEAKDKAAREQLQANGGLCIQCSKDKADPNGINPYHCPECNNKTAKILEKLQGKSGFVMM
jgi:hypothetical protein